MKTTYDSEGAVVLGMLSVVLAVLVGGCSYKNTNEQRTLNDCTTDMECEMWESPREYAQGWENE